MDPYYVKILYGITTAFTVLLFLAAVSDATRYVIPNTVIIGVLVLFGVAAILLPFDIRWELHLGALGTVLVAGLVAYRFKALGAGDVKLISALALWTGFEQLPELLLYTAIAGGALALILIATRKLLLGVILRFPSLEPAVKAAVLRTGEKVPYGIAIAIGGMVTGLTLPHLGLFITSGTFT